LCLEEAISGDGDFDANCTNSDMSGSFDVLDYCEGYIGYLYFVGLSQHPAHVAPNPEILKAS
jgi:hypothetical protein